MQVELPVTVECVCGAVQLQCDAPPLTIIKCHCNACQKTSGTMFEHNARFSADKVRCLYVLEACSAPMHHRHMRSSIDLISWTWRLSDDVRDAAESGEG
jgi:hypothetical protein